jgi:hypothetical protein
MYVTGELRVEEVAVREATGCAHPALVFGDCPRGEKGVSYRVGQE